MKQTSKFNVSTDTSKRTYNGIVFDSVLEMKYYIEVVLPGVEQGTIERFELQKRYVLQPKFVHEGKTIQAIDYKADFYIKYTNGDEQVIDIKGCPDPKALIKRKMFWYIYPNLQYDWIGYSKIDGGWVKYEDIKAGRKERKKIKEQKGEKGNGKKSRKSKS